MKFIFIVTSILISCMSQAQESYTTKVTHSIGLHAGLSTGYGFSYRYWPKRIGLEVTAIPIFNGNKNAFVSSGLSGLYLIKEYNRLNVFGYLGAHYIYETSFQYVNSKVLDDFGNSIYEEKLVTNNTINVGLGFGTNINILKELSLSLQTGYALYNIVENLGGNLTGEIGLYYHLK
ncbi:hypothetical protein DNU06_05210 [Putridiphycobacter roseus]|uniref:Outer membrane protein beta-barrel domain-containing protein n=1 Tax=Putridiphycobacter roseus TaxID=2219161 RepID=A0A2W1N198_9FLAO|nr:hypothetical protein [Putridiphycobacter roseus]PZE18017.1 hypothetical protein DNU06_05210 [Putridiphycobacter roseus]